MDIEKLKKRCGYDGKPQQFKYGFDLACRELVNTVEQAAKAQAVPEGFVLVPKEPTPKMIDSTWNYDEEIQEMSHNSRNEFIYKKMIEVQEQVSG